MYFFPLSSVDPTIMTDTCEVKNICLLNQPKINYIGDTASHFLYVK